MEFGNHEIRRETGYVALRQWFFAFLISVALLPNALAKERLQAQANVMVEITFTAEYFHQDPFNDVTLDILFRDPSGHNFRVPAFWDGSNVWKVRYASPITGKHTFRSECSDKADPGLNDVTGIVLVKPYVGTNPIYIHGPLRVAADHRHLEHADGTPFFWLGDTWWMGLSHRLHWPEDVQKLATDRKEKGFNVIQIVAGLYPDMFPFDKRGANEAGFPWETNFTTIRPEYFDAADKRLEYLADQGFTPCIVGAWGYFLPWMGVDKMKAHWRYLIARYGALPTVWCVAGEANLPWYLAKGFPYDDREQVKGWTEVARYLRATDPFHHLITIHPTGLNRLSSRNAINDLSLIDFDFLQTPHGQQDAVSPTVSTVRASYADKPTMPVIDGEAAYEMLGGTIGTEWTRQMFWLCMMNGTAGHTYGANGIWQNNRRGDPHGPSPYPGSPPTGYGTISWDDAMNLPGSTQVALGKKFLQRFNWWKFTPHPEWAEFSARPPISLTNSQWIWFPEGDPTKDAPAAKRYFRLSFVLPDNKTVAGGRLRISADDKFDVMLNENRLGGSTNWHEPREFDDIVADLKSGTNVIAVLAENLPANIPNPAGLIAAMQIQFTDGQTMQIVSDDAWRCATNSSPGWNTVTFDDSSWVKALSEAHYGSGPWGQFDTQRVDPLHGPQSAGIPDTVRVTYVPTSKPILVHDLGPWDYRATYFDPVNGTNSELGSFSAEENGSRLCSPPIGCDHDWILVLEAKTSRRRY